MNFYHWTLITTKQTGNYWRYHPEVKTPLQDVARQILQVHRLIGHAKIKSLAIRARLVHLHTDSMGVTAALETGGQMPALQMPPGTAETWDGAE
jgi:hypothetical protein